MNTIMTTLASASLFSANTSQPRRSMLRGFAALNVDYEVLLGFTVIATLATILGNLLADVSYAVLDPRVRYS